MQLEPLTAVSPIDGRYRLQLEHLSKYFSEYALIKYRVKIEVEYFTALAEEQLFSLDKSAKSSLENIVDTFSITDAEKIKATEKITNHDVKAVEYFLKEKLVDLNQSALQEWIHFGLTSQDINNTAFPLLWKDALQHEYIPDLKNMITNLLKLSTNWKEIPMLARTHGQPASPTTLGKEFMVFVERLNNQLNQLNAIPFTGKFGGATGNFNAHVVAFPKTDWIRFANSFLKEKLGLERQQYTTQIEHYDMLAAQFDALKRINTILIDFCRDVWTYISMDYFKQKVKKDEVGSSAMPHKVNPIDFENAEGNLGLANALFDHLSGKLPVSRLQRDLTDSTVLRSIGMPMAHTILAFKSVEKGLNKLILHEEKLAKDLDDNWVVVAEAIQTILRRENYPRPYEALKSLTRGGDGISHSTILDFINSLEVSDSIKDELKNITPHNYVGHKIK
jgi:adenylosuccinate lyase